MNAPALASIARDKYGRGSGKYDCSVRNVRTAGLVKPQCGIGRLVQWPVWAYSVEKLGNFLADIYSER